MENHSEVLDDFRGSPQVQHVFDETFERLLRVLEAKGHVREFEEAKRCCDDSLRY